MRTFNGIEDERRLDYIEEYLSSEKTIFGFCKEKGLAAPSFRIWLRTFGIEEKQTEADMDKTKDPTNEELREEVRNLRNEVQSLKTRLKRSEMARDVYDYMIDLAEKEFNIPIRKKSDAG